MNTVQSFPKALALCVILLVATAVTSASEITGTLTSGTQPTNSSNGTSGTLAGTVTQPTQTSGGGGGGGGGIAIGNGPPVPNGSSYNFAVGGGSGFGGVTSDVVTNPSQTSYTFATASPAQSTSGESSSGYTDYTSEKFSFGDEIIGDGVVAQTDTVVDTSTPNVVVTTTTVDNPGQFAAVMTSLGDGDVMTWLLALFALLLVVIAGGYLYDWFVQPQEYERVQR